MPDGRTPERRLARLPDVATEQLVAVYEDAARLLRAMIAGAIRRGALGTAVQRQRQLRAVDRALEDLRRKATGLATLSIAGGYRVGGQAADLSAREILPAAAGDLLEPAFASGANRGAVQALQAASERKLDDAISSVGRAAEDLFRRVALEEVSLGTAAGFGRRETSARIANRLAGEGLTAFVDRAGRRWKLDTYARMVARTTQREAASLGTVDRMVQVGLDLVKFSKHRNPCPVCKPYEGVVYSISGKTEGYPKLVQLAPIHPGCEHAIGAARENLDLLGIAAAA